jgi:hypothetical protein
MSEVNEKGSEQTALLGLGLEGSTNVLKTQDNPGVESRLSFYLSSGIKITI